MVGQKIKYYSAQEAASVLGISKQTLIRYEKRGVFPRPKRNSINGWREYTQRQVAELRRILGRTTA
ncbi:MAG: MerR family transcriptional regulator [Candidatus Omnitrophica bacterium]|nr:MerR family transcriptional regulator [Candidatus Omnitrophota bacterium]